MIAGYELLHELALPSSFGHREKIFFWHIHLINDHTFTQVGNKEDDALAESDPKDSSHFEGSYVASYATSQLGLARGGKISRFHETIAHSTAGMSSFLRQLQQLSDLFNTHTDMHACSA